MYRNLNHLVTFAALAETGSFAGAARRLNLPSSTVSEHIAALEKNLGLQLVVRNTRKSRLTESGRRLAVDASRMVAVVEEAMAAIDTDREHPQGKLRISLPFAFAAELIGPAVGRFARRHPGIELEFVVSNDVQDLIAGGFDMAVRIGKLTDSSLVRRSLGVEPQLLVAARSYLETKGSPDSLETLGAHCFVGYPKHQTRRFDGPDGAVALQVECRIVANDPKTIHAIVLGGGGIALLPRFLVEGGLADGSLEIVLPAYRAEAVEMSIVHYGPSSANPRVELFAAFVQSEIAARGRRALTD
ncbi:LysR family transcriptional regulator [Oricola indica]|jgi:DNA-binding transcriptional LysR family regulator|uniref:LysR family transcriptional regulator n=1 Tax=Oricola indica TaxID=2872591 RepID=UPI001CC1A6CA|nr:LysR family transcriptional regulator [Oricola indica]